MLETLPREQLPPRLKVSVPVGRWGPCCSVAPIGSTVRDSPAAARNRSRFISANKGPSGLVFPWVERWSSSNRNAGDAFRVGTAHGLYCVGCCWSLMLVMFAAGAGSLAWMLVLGIVMAMEKNLPWGRRLSAPTGVVLLIAALVAAIS